MNRRTTLTLEPHPRGFHLITDRVEQALASMDRVEAGVLHVFIRHTSASLALNENASPDVRRDLEAWMRRAAPDGADYFRHTEEGPDDMSAHVKNVLIGPSLMLPVARGRLDLGTWQGVYLGEHRERASSRTLTLTLLGA
jgi:secondary thiamine-phosphate synthase enzyme